MNDGSYRFESELRMKTSRPARRNPAWHLTCHILGELQLHELKPQQCRQEKAAPANLRVL